MKPVILVATMMERSLIETAVSELNLPILNSGIGMVNTAICLSQYFNGQNPKPQAILHLGIGGYRGESDFVGSAVVAESEWFADSGVAGGDQQLGYEEIGIPLHDGEPVIYNKIPIDGRLSRNLATRHGLPLLPFATVASCSGDPSRVLLGEIGKEFVENMEGAAAAYVAMRHRIPYLEVRGISNRVGDRDKANWQIKEAMQSVAELIPSILEESEHFDE